MARKQAPGRALLRRYDSFSALLGSKLEASGLKQRAAASAMGVSQSMISKWRTGRSQPESAEVVGRVAAWLHVDPTDLRGALDVWASRLEVLPPSTQAAIEHFTAAQAALIREEVRQALDEQDRAHAAAIRSLRKSWERRMARLEGLAGLPPAR